MPTNVILEATKYLERTSFFNKKSVHSKYYGRVTLLRSSSMVGIFRSYVPVASLNIELNYSIKSSAVMV